MASSPPGGRRVPWRALVVLATVVALTASAGFGYTVRPGETLSGIAARNGVSISALATANRISDADFIRAGQQLRLPGPASGGGSAAAATVHTVRGGETLIAISVRYGVKMAVIAAANGLRDYDRVYAGQRLKIPGRAAVVAGATASRGPSSAEVGAIIDRTARQYGFHPRFIKAIAYQESGWNNRVVSSAGAIGIMQVIPSTGQFVSSYLVGRRLDLHDPEDNVLAGVAFVAHLWKLTGGSPEKTLAGYYQGLASVRRNGMYPSTRQYIRNVMYLRGRFD